MWRTGRSPQRGRRLRLAAIVAVFSMLAAACGQLEGVRGQGEVVVAPDDGQLGGGQQPEDAGEAAAEGGADAPTGTSGDGGASAAPSDPGGTTSTAPTEREPRSDGSSSGGGSTEAGGGDGGGATSGEPASGGEDSAGTAGGTSEPRGVQGSDRTGVGDDRIDLGAHAPVTGAAPLPSRSFEESSDSYWRYIVDDVGETILGRSQVVGHFRDDRYQPSTAVQVCRELAEETFMLVGGGGTDQLQACGQFANRARVPYLSPGVTEEGLRGLDWYFAAAMSYRQQGRLLAELVATRFPNAKAAGVFSDTPNFDDAVQGWESSVAEEGVNYHRTFRPGKGDTAWYNTVARELSQEGVDVVYMLVAPVDYIRFAQQASQQGYEPQYIGCGICSGLNPVVEAGCPDVDEGLWLSPFPGLDWAEQHRPEFFETQQRLGAPADDISLAIWGFSEIQHELFSGYGEQFGDDLTREDFRWYAERRGPIETGLFPRIEYSPDNHFGGQAMHLLQADCSVEQMVTVDTFVTSFR